MADFISGKHCIAKVYLGNPPAPWNIIVKSTKVEEVAELAADGVNGETRDRLQKITKYYNVTHEVYDDGQSSALLKTWLANQANEDAGAPQLPFAGGLRFNYLDGTAGGFTMTGCNLGPLSYSTN